MAATLFYADRVPGVGELVVVDGDEGFHAATVRRIRPGEVLVISDGKGVAADCVVRGADKRSLTAEVVARRVESPSEPPVTVVQAIPKAERSELAVELATEAGADAFIAWQADRCVARWEGDRAAKGLRRWAAVARSAARQSRRPWIPAVDGPVSTAGLRSLIGERVGAGGLALVLHESADRAITDSPVAQADSIMLMIGPEGGVSDGELAGLQAAGAVAVRLGPTVLRTSTAAAVALGALGVLSARWSIDR